MDRGKAGLTVFFEGPFWVGVFERVEDGKLSVCRVVFGSEPRNYEVWEFVTVAEGREEDGAQVGRQGAEGGREAADV